LAASQATSLLQFQLLFGVIVGVAAGSFYAPMISIGMALGPWAGGWIFDIFNGYGWLYIGSFGIGLGVVAIALAFPPFPSRQRAVAQPA
jgi:MFS family permease